MRNIDAPIDLVFSTVADISNYSKAVPYIKSFEILSDVKSGVGTRFRETRVVRDKETISELEVTEFVENDHVRIVTDSHGTVWDSTFSVAATDNGTELTLTMDANAYELLPRLINPFIRGMVRKGVAADLDAVKAYCEGASDASV